jgi:hypothetical protein
MNKYTLELTEEELDYLDNFIHEHASIEDYYDVGTFKISVFAKVCDLCEYSLKGGSQ